MTPLRAARTYLFVPANRPDRFEKAQNSGADVVIIDLEDAVPPAEKEAAREHAVQWISRNVSTVVRVNGRKSRWFQDDCRALVDSAIAIMIPKSEAPDDVAAIADLRPLHGVIPLIETPRGLLEVETIARVPGVERLAFGNGDLAASMGVDYRDAEALRYARSRIVVASAAAGLNSPIDGVTTSIDDQQTLRRDVLEAKRLGFGAKLCIHPQQLSIVHHELRPSSDTIKWALAVTQVERQGAHQVDGEMIDGPILERARRVLAESGDPASRVDTPGATNADHTPEQR